MGRTIRNGAQDQINQMGEKASMWFDRGRQGVYGVVRLCERYVQRQPLRAVAMAVGVG